MDLVTLLRSRDSLVTSGQAIVGLPGRYTSMKEDQLKGELKAKKVDWLKSSGPKKADLVVLVDSMTSGGWQPSKRKPREKSHLLKPRFWKDGCDCDRCSTGGFGGFGGFWVNAIGGLFWGGFGGYGGFGGPGGSDSDSD